MTALSSGYMAADAGEGKCGEGKCGGDKKDTTEPTGGGTTEPTDDGEDGSSGGDMIPMEKMDEVNRTFERKQMQISRCFVAGVDAGEIEKNDKGAVTVGAVITPEGKDNETFTDLYAVRDGVIVIPKNTVIPPGSRL